jgi:glucose/arabinose dehydrogenase
MQAISQRIESCVRAISCALFTFVLAACSDIAKLPEQADTGPTPTLVAPKPTKIPTINIAPAKGWPAGTTPVAGPGLAVNAFATEFDHPRWIYVLPNGDVLVAEANRPAKKPSGLRAWIMSKVQKRAGAGTPSADRITLVRDADGDGTAEVRSIFLSNLFSPFGMALVGDQLYVANADAIVRFPYTPGALQITAAPTKVADLPGGPINHHWTKNIIASRDGKRLYATVGSNSNIGENGMDNEVNRAAVLEVDLATGATRLYASGLRNPNGLGWQPESGALWTVVNERDELGSDLVPDYLTSVREGGFYGWPYSYFGQHVDARVKPPRPDLVAQSIVPDYGLGAHVAPLGLAFYDAKLLPSRYEGGAFIGLHGSWNRRPLSGYKVVFVPFANGKPAGRMEDVLTGFVDPDGNAYGRPVGVAIDKTGAILVADDVGNAVWRVVPTASRQAAELRSAAGGGSSPHRAAREGTGPGI